MTSTQERNKMKFNNPLSDNRHWRASNLRAVKCVTATIPSAGSHWMRWLRRFLGDAVASDIIFLVRGSSCNATDGGRFLLFLVRWSLMNEQHDGNEKLRQEQPDMYVRPWMLPYLPRAQGQRDLIMALVSLLLGLVLFFLLSKLFNDVVALIGDSLIVGHFGGYYFIRLAERWRKNNGRK